MILIKSLRHPKLSDFQNYKKNNIKKVPSLTEFRKVSDDKMGYYFNRDFFKNGLNVRVNSSCEHSSRANPDHLMHDESRGPGIWYLIVSRAPGNLQTKKKLAA